jgi:23S rRNA (adenine2503-C2)-methyltransferase
VSLIDKPINILDFTPGQLADFIKQLGEPVSQADVLLKSIYRDCAAGFEDMASLRPSLKQKLAERASLAILEPLEEKVSADGQTRKVLFRFEDGKTVEATLMFSRITRTGRERRTVCVSSQVGCPVGCKFCATGLQGFERNLTPGEILGQVLYFSRRFGSTAKKPGNSVEKGWLTNVVFMGMGEPLANLDNVRAALEVINSPRGFGLGLHQVTLSTSGLIPQMLELADEAPQFQMAVSLHTANNELRGHLVPINKKYPLEELVAACREYSLKTGRKIFIEYALFSGINDSTKDADDLVRLLDGLSCSVNLILGNPAGATDFKPSGRETALAFQRRLINGGVRTMLRVSRGADIEAGCGQLRSRWLEKDDPGPGV